MTTMSIEAPSFLPHGRALTYDDLGALPDDGHRYELIDGVLIVSPAPRIRHQQLLSRLFRVIDDACPPQLMVLFAPVDVVLSQDTVIQPDLLVARVEAFTEAHLPSAPTLAVEVLSPSTRGVDLLLKKERLQRAGCPHYWVIDPVELSIVAWVLVDGAYVEVARGKGEEVFEVAHPFPIHFTPNALLA